MVCMRSKVNSSEDATGYMFVCMFAGEKVDRTYIAACQIISYRACRNKSNSSPNSFCQEPLPVTMETELAISRKYARRFFRGACLFEPLMLWWKIFKV